MLSYARVVVLTAATALVAVSVSGAAWGSPNAVQDSNAPPPPIDEQTSDTVSPDPNGAPLQASQSLTPIQTPADATSTPASRYGRLDRATCEAELKRRHIGFIPVGDSPGSRGVLAPVRLTTPVHGVTYHSALPTAQRARSPYEILDCRLVLALDDFGAILQRYDVVEVIHFSVYRPPSSRWPAGRMGHAHDGALAIDAGWFKRKDGSTLQVERDFHGRIGSSTCGPGAGPHPATPEALALRHIACDAAAAHLFNVELTPDYNWPHRNHFHLEVRPNVRWFLVH